MIKSLQDAKDSLVCKFADEELYPFKMDNHYYFPEDSETEQPGVKKIVVKDVQ